jgi:TPR repeat protein
MPQMALVPTNAPTGAVAQSAPLPRVLLQPAPLAKPSLDKAELDRRVVTFQQQRAREGSVSAQYELGRRYLKGDGVAQDRAAARKWLTEAANGGSTEARKQLRELDAANK